MGSHSARSDPVHTMAANADSRPKLEMTTVRYTSNQVALQIGYMETRKSILYIQRCI